MDKVKRDENESNISLDIYKYRKRPDRNNIFKLPISDSEHLSDENHRNTHGEFEKPKQGQKKTYAILQENRTEFANSRLRYALLIYTNPAWQLLILAVLLIAYILETWLYTFCTPKTRPFWIIILIICLNLIFTFDVVIIFGLKFFKKWRRTLNIVEPETSRVVLDVTLAMPYGLMYLPDLRVFNFDMCVIAPFVAAIRVYRILQYFYNKSSQAGRNQWSTFLFQYLILFMLSVHTLTCVWYHFAYREFAVQRLRSSWSAGAIHLPTESVYDWYLVCAYWSVMFLTTNALGDLYPITTAERITATMAIILGFLLTTIVFVGSLTSQFITITTRRSKYVLQLTKIKNHLKLINMNADTTERIIRYYEDVWYQKSGVFKPKLMDILPYPLRMEICYDLNAVPLYSSLIFRKLPEPFLRRLSLAMAHQFYLPGDIVYNHNQTKTIMICITSGVLELLSDEDDESPMISFAKGTCFGEISLVYNIPARSTVKAATYVECQVLHKKDFIKLMITYPDLVEKIRAEIEQRIDRSQRRKRSQCTETPLSLNIYATKKLKKSSIKCLKDKLRSIQGNKGGIDLSPGDNLDLHCLDLYILSEHVKKRTAMFTCIDSNLPWILEADCNLVKFWELYMLCIVSYMCLVYPYCIGFLRSFPDGVLYYIEIVISISLLFNILMNCVTAVKTKKKYVKKFSSIISYRLNTLGFYLDLIANIPLEYLVSIHTYVVYVDNHRKHLFYLSKGIKLCLVWRLSNFFENLEKKLLFNTIIVKVVKYWVFICLLCYWCGVILFMEACFVNRCSEDSWYTKIASWEYHIPGRTITKNEFPLITSLYFSTTLILSVGYGDIIPGDHFDMGLVAFLSLYGLLLIGYCVAEFSAVVTHWSRTKTAFLEVILTIDKFMMENNMHPAIKSRIMAFYELQWQYNSGVELTGENWLEKTVVPPELRKKVLHQARFKTLTSIPFFQVKNKAFIQTLTETARDVILPPGEIVYYGGTVSKELYIIESGYCLVTSKQLRETKRERVIGPGNHLGLLVLLYGVPAVSTVVTLTHCKLITIGHSAYTSALSLFPDMREHDNLLTPNELDLIETEAKSQNTGDYLKHYNHHEDKKIRITSFFQDLFNGSFINVYNEYSRNKQSYFKSYKQFHVMQHVAPYLLIPVTIKPEGAFLKTWAIIRVATAFLLCLLIPINVSMAPMCKLLNIPLFVLECICYIDLYLMLHVAFYGSKNQLITHPYLTAKNYLKGAFIIDFLTCWPWYAMWQIFIPKHDEGHSNHDHLVSPHMFHCIVRMINVLQIYKLYAAFWTESIGALKRAYLMSVVQFILLMLFFLNLYTSLLIILSCHYVVASNANDFKVRLAKIPLKGPYMESKYHPNGNMICQLGSWIDTAKIVQDDHLSPMKVVLLGYYWSASTFSGAGFGDITAQDTTHMILSICIAIHGVLFFGYVYARIASLKAMADQMVTKFQENLKHLELFLNREKVPPVLRQNVVDYWKYQWKRTGGWSHQSILGKLHANLNEDAVLYMYEKTLQEIPLFEDVEYSFFRAFAKKLSELYFQKGYMVMRANEVFRHIYIIYRGKVDVISEFNEVEACMGPGGIFGNIRGASMYLTMSNVVASRNIDLLRIDGPEFYALLKSYPSVLRKVKQSVASAPKDYVLPTMLSEKRSSVVNTYPTSSSSGEEDDESNLDDFMESPDKSIAESHGSRSITSAGNAEYIPATILLFQPHRWFRSSVIPDCKWIQFIEYLISFLSYIDFMILVYQMAFQSIPYFFYMCVISDLFFLYKLFLDIHTGYVNRYGDYVLNPKKVRKLFFSRTLLRRRDFLANLPISYFAFALKFLQPNLQMILFCYLRTTQLFRITYLFTYRTHRKISMGSSNLFFKLLTIGIWASILSHINACLFFKLSCLTPKQCVSANWMSKQELNLQAQYLQKNYFSLYIAALWYMINLLTITGTGDVSSQNDFEVIETIIIIVVIKFCTGLLISEMSAMITAHSSSRIAYDYGINELRDGLRDMDLSEHQMNKMWDYVRELWNRQQGRQMPELVYELPFRLRCQVMQAVYGSHISESVIFSRTDADFRRMLAMWIKHCVFFPGNYIVQCGDADQCIYFIHRGEVEVLTVHPNLTESIYDVLGPEDCFGLAQGLFVGVSHHFSFRARTVVDIVYLRLEQWKYLLDFYPKSAKMVQKKVQNVYLAI